MKRAGTPSPELVHDLRGIVATAIYADAEGVDPDERDRVSTDVVDALLPTIASVDENAHNRGRTDVPEWVEVLTNARNLEGPGLVALCDELADDEDAPPALREIARRFVSAGLYRVDRPRARTGDPATSQAAAERVRVGVTRPDGQVHRILEAYEAAERMYRGTPNAFRTAREIEFAANVKEAHKRTSELLADGLLEVVQSHGVDTAGHGTAIVDISVDLIRGGGRVLRITADGRTELARLNAARDRRREREQAKADRRRRRAQRGA